MKKVQKVKATYFPTKNYIGCSEWQYKITKYIFKKSPLLNYISFWHDILYGHILHKAESIISMLILKTLIDLIFLSMGTLGSLIKLDLRETSTTILLYIALFISTIPYIYNLNKNQSKKSVSA